MNRRSSPLSLPRASFWQIGLLTAFVWIAGLWLMAANAAQAQESGESAPGYHYTVQEGDTWESVAQRTGVSVEQLQEANPDAVRDTGWLINGEQLFIPTSTPTQNKTHVVKAGESWASIAAQYGIPVSLLRAANPGSIRSGSVLYEGERLTIPPAGATVPTAVPTPVPRLQPGRPAAATATPAATATAIKAAEAPTVEPTEEPTAEPTAESTAEPAEEAATGTVTETAELTGTDTLTTAEEISAAEEVTGTGEVTDAEEITAAEPVTGASEVTSTAETTGTTEVTSTTEVTGAETITDTAAGAAGFDLPACPEKFADYSEMMADVVNRNEDGIGAVQAFLEDCAALVEEGAFTGDLTGDGSDDLVVVYQNPSQDQIFIEGDLAIFNSSPDGLVLSYRARAAGEVRLLATEDINADTLADVVWVDTTCGASTCFDTVNVRSWDGSAWADWTDGTITMAYAEITLEDRSEEGAGQEIVLSGGIYGSVGAGPQRSRTEVWASLEGAPYTLLEKAYSASECLYHTVLDANRAFLDAPVNGFDAASLLYTQAAADENLIKCWVRNDELAELRSFSLFRLALIAGYQGDIKGAAAHLATLSETYPGSIYDAVGQQWWTAFEANEDAAAACAEVTTYVEENPAAWEMLADYGYTNPSFEAADVCPVLDLGGDEHSGDAAGDEGTKDAGEEGQPSSPPTSSVGDDSVGAAAAAAPTECPADLAGYAEALPPVLSAAGGDQAAIESWLRTCGVLTDDLGAVVLAELDDDGLPDAIVYPTLITDLGYGPDGAQGAVLIFHSEADGSYTLVANPEIYGQPAPLAVGDLNADGRTDIAWTVTGCSTFCVLEVQMWTWDGDAYLALIEPGATIAAGRASFTPLPAGAPGDGQQLLLEGGVSGTPEGGLAVPHSESWQSIDGGLYRRIAWAYDRTVEGSDCLGLRLVEADVALHASDVVGYGPAIELYGAALDSELAACSILGLAESQELALLRGLARFRLIQAQALSGDLDAARDSLATLAAAQPDAEYTAAATQWLDAMQAGEDPAAACIAVGSIFANHPELWQITDQFGYNHPALAAGQVCYTP